MPVSTSQQESKKEKKRPGTTHTTSHDSFTLTPHLTLPSPYRVDVAGQADARMKPRQDAAASGIFGQLEYLHHPSTATDHQRVSTAALERVPAEVAHDAVVHARAGGVLSARGEV